MGNLYPATNIRRSACFLCKIFLCVLLLFAGSNAFGQANDLIISEYGEGSSGNSKYVELYNGTGAAVNLGNYRIWMGANGAAFPGTAAQLSGTLADGATYVIGNNASDVPGATIYLSGPTSFNGDDAFGLAKNIAGTYILIDVIGTPGTDPGTGWAVAGTANATVDRRLTRKPTVCSPNTDWAESAGTTAANSEWIITGTYTTGAAVAGHTMTCASPLTPVNGDIIFTDVNSRGDGFEFITTRRLDLTSLKFTDNGICNDNRFRLSETLSIPTNGGAWTNVPAGTLVRIAMDNTGSNDNTTVDGTLYFTSSTGGINASGESIVAYTGTAQGAAACGGSGTNVYVSGIIWETDWNTGTTSDATSKAPGTITDFYAGINDNRYFNGAVTGDASTLKSTGANGVRNSALWTGNNNDPNAFNTSTTLKNILFNESTISGTPVFSGVSTTGFTINASGLTSNGNADTRYAIVIRAGATPDNPADRYTCYNGISGNFNTAPDVITSVSGQTTYNTCGTTVAGNGKVVYFDYTLPSALTITNLASGVNYTVSIFAINGNGYSANVSSTVATGSQTVSCVTQTISGLATTASRVYGTAPYALAATATSSLAVSYSSSVPAVASVSGNTVTINRVGVTVITASQAGNTTYCAAPNVNQTLTITAKPLTISGLIANNKVFDGTTAATLSGTPLLTGIVGTDDVSIAGTYIANFNTALVGTNKPVTVSGYTLTGADAGNYTLTQPAGLTADITASPNAVFLTPVTQGQGPFCNATTNIVSLDFTTTGTVTTPFIRLSNVTGSFAAGTTDLLSNITGSGPYTITATIPAGQAAGTAYRIRIISADALPVTSDDNNSNIIISGQPNPAAIGGGAATVCVGATTVAFTNATSGGAWSVVSITGAASITAGGIVTGVTAGDVNVLYTITNGTCTATVSRLLNVLPAAADPTGTITGETPACGSSLLTYSEASATSYWQTAANGTSTANPATTGRTVITTGNYYVRNFNGTCWSTASVGPFAVIIRNGAAIGTQPSNQSVTAPASATFSVVASNASGYQWQVNTGSGFVNIAGATTATYNTGTTSIAMDGNVYKCIIKGLAPCGDITSNSATLTVLAGLCGSETFTSLNATAGSYTAGSFTGDNGVIWNYNQARLVTSGDNITGTSIGFSDAGTGYVRANSGAGGVGTLTFKMRSYFTAGTAASRIIQVYVNGALKGTYTLAAFSTVYTNNVTANEAGNVLVEFRSTGSRQVVIDDVSWSCYAGACAPSTTVTSFLPQSGPVATLVTIKGTGFSTTPAANGVKFGNISSTAYTIIDNTTIIAEVPAGVAATSAISVANGTTCFSNALGTFTLIAAAGTCSSLSDLIISEVYDAESGNEHYIEIYNGTANTINLDGPDYEISVENNPAGNITTWDISGSIAPGEVKVYYGGVDGGLATGIQTGATTGFNDGFDEVRLLKDGVVIDRMIGPDEKGFTCKRKITVTGPNAAYNAAEWDILSAESTDDIGLFLTASAIAVTVHPVDQFCNFSMSIVASGAPTGYQWKYYNTATNLWTNVSQAAFPGTVIPATGAGSATSNSLTITGNIAPYLNYQFYCEIKQGAVCSKASNAAQFLYNSLPVYRSNIIAGNWTTPGSWQMSADGTNFVTTCTYPVALNSTSVIIRNGQKIQLNDNIEIDKLTIDAGGELEILPSSKLTVKNSQAGADLFINGTLTDRGSSSNGVDYEDNTGTTNDASWILGASGMVVKTNTSSAAKYRDFYNGGIANMPSGAAGAAFIYRYNGDGSPSVVSANMIYPNLYFENTTAVPFSFGGNINSVLSGGTSSTCRVQGNMFIGTTGSNAVTVFNNSLNPTSLFAINGNLSIGAGSQLTNASHDGGSSASYGNGAGFDIKGNVTVNGILNVRSGNNATLKFSGTSNQLIDGDNATPDNMNISRIAIANTAGALLINDKNLNIISTLNFAGNSQLQFAAGNITLRSTAASTASVEAIPSTAAIAYPATGRFIIERFINVGPVTPTTHGKSWQFLATPVQGEAAVSIRENWQEGGNSIAGFGTWITDPAGTGAANGFDTYSVGTSIKKYNSSTNTWSSAGSTLLPVTDKRGYMLFVRGDRTVNSAAVNATGPTTLRIKGKIYDAAVANRPPSTTITAGDRLESVGNPYASAIDFKLLYQRPGANIDNVFYVWDPTLTGSDTYGVGGYQSISVAAGYIATPGGGKIYDKPGRVYDTIQSGQAFFVKSISAGNADISFDESVKVGGSDLVNRGGTGVNGPIPMLSTMLFTADGRLADGNRVVFDKEYSNDIDGYDAGKISNSGENFGSLRNGKTLAVEARQQLTVTDTIFYKMNNVQPQTYQLVFAAQDLISTGLHAELIDNYLGNRTTVNLTDSTFIPIVVTAAAASKAADRFLLVFRPLSPLPVNILNITATRNNDQSVAVAWTTANEINIEKYVVERSADGVSFFATGNVAAANSNHYTYNDVSPLAGNNYYRIKAVGANAAIQYSNVVKVAPVALIASINVYPNPVKNNIIYLHFKNCAQGKYQLELTNNIGQQVQKGTVSITGNNVTQKIILNKIVAADTYQLKLVHPDGGTQVLQIVFE